MGEIKSTMDIIMEKLKKIEISEEDKKRLLKKEAEETAKKLFAEYIEKGDPQAIIEQLNRLKEEKKEETKKALLKEAINRIQPYGSENEKIILLMSKLLKTDLSHLRKMISLAEEGLDKIKERCEKELLNKVKKREIYGSAVIPNIEVYPEWEKALKQVSDKLRSDMDNFISQLQ